MTPKNAVMLCKGDGGPVRVFTSWEAGLRYIAYVYSEYVSSGVTDMRDANIAMQRVQHWGSFRGAKLEQLSLMEVRPDDGFETFLANREKQVDRLNKV